MEFARSRFRIPSNGTMMVTTSTRNAAGPPLPLDWAMKQEKWVRQKHGKVACLSPNTGEDHHESAISISAAIPKVAKRHRPRASSRNCAAERPEKRHYGQSRPRIRNRWKPPCHPSLPPMLTNGGVKLSDGVEFSRHRSVPT